MIKKTVRNDRLFYIYKQNQLKGGGDKYDLLQLAKVTKKGKVI